MHNKKLTIAGLVALVVVLVLVGLSYNKERSDMSAVSGGGMISKTNPVGTYVAFLRAADTAERTIMLQLSADSPRNAVMTSDYHNTQAPIIDRGTWSSTAQGFAIAFTNKNGIELSKPEVLNFSISSSVAQLLNADKVTWGSAGLVFGRSPLQLPSEWLWQYTTLKDGKKIASQQNKPFILSLTGENKVNVQGDCNAISGSFGLRANNGIVFSPLASTRVYCEVSQENVFTQDLSRATAYRISGNNLLLTLPNESGVMTFIRR